MKRGLITLLGSALALLALCPTGAVARDLGRHGQVSPDIKSWIEGLTDKLGVNCCAIADGVRPEETEWDMQSGHYRVKIQGQWFRVPTSAVVTPNRLGHAVVWYYYDTEFIVIRCFLPGSSS